jgi:hypothetical protein
MLAILPERIMTSLPIENAEEFEGCVQYFH